ncbi:MAG: DNA polymerase III subunit beta [Saccharofermentanales bacterium]|jgi:DNA polymerase-3 subunit beta|nr:DNA polymerase III subunit beta [Bacillota bacterium]
MRFECSRTNLVEAINTVQKAVSSRSTIPILDGILLEVTDQIKLTGYDLETGIESKLDAEIYKAGSIVIKSRLLGDIVRRLPEEAVHFNKEDNNIITIESGSSSFQLRGLPAEDYPKIPIVEDARQMIVPQKTLKEMIMQTSFAASIDESRPILNGINIISEQGTLSLVAIDGFRLAVRKEQIAGDLPDSQFIVPARTLNEVARVLEDDGNVNIFTSHNHILFDMGKVLVVSRLIQGEFMNYNSILPRNHETSMTISTRNLLSAFERASLVIRAEDRRFSVTLQTNRDDILSISAKTDIGASHEELNIAMSGKLFDIDFNPKYFIEALKVIPDEEVLITFNGSLGPCVINPVEKDAFSYLVLPLRR